jgi:hypothetical protein
MRLSRLVLFAALLSPGLIATAYGQHGGGGSGGHAGGGGRGGGISGGGGVRGGSVGGFRVAQWVVSGAATDAAVIILAVVGTAGRASILDSAVTRITATDTVTRITDTIPMLMAMTLMVTVVAIPQRPLRSRIMATRKATRPRVKDRLGHRPSGNNRSMGSRLRLSPDQRTTAIRDSST